MLVWGVIATLWFVGCQGFQPSRTELTPEALKDVEVKSTVIQDDCNKENGSCHTSNKLAKMYATIGKPCDCGAHSVGCTFVNDKKICTCEYGYGQAPNDTCIKACRCKNGMYCRQNLCVCRNGQLSGAQCEIVDYCKGTARFDKCGDPVEVTCGFWPECQCNNRTLFYDSKERICGECECGAGGKSCSLEKRIKKCECEDDHVMAEKGAYLEGECRPCDCGPNNDNSYFSFKCKFNSSGKFCNCKEGFAQRAGKCAACTCGKYATCSFDGYRKVCTCDKGYVMQDGQCVACDCGPYCSCYYDKDGKKISECIKNAIQFGDKCVECDCGNDGKCALDKEGKKTCTCDKGFGDREGYCIDCQCYFEDKIMECSFTNKTQNCHCPQGYKAVDFFCLPDSSN